MTVPTGTYQTYQTVGIREDLSDMIYDLSPVDTPFLSNIGRGKCSQSKFEWQIDSLAAANGANAVIEGDDATTNTASATTRLSNHTQLMDKVVRVSSRNQAVNAAGRKNELSYQVAKRAKELKRDQETRLTGNYGDTAGAAAIASTTAGYEAWITSNESRGSGAGATQGSAGGYANGKASAATDASSTNTRTFTEALLKTVIKSCWENGGSPNMVMVGGHNKQVASNFNGIATQYRDNPKAAQATIIGAADVYVSDFGTFSIVPNRFSRAKSALVIDPEMWSVAYLQPYKVTDLAKTGHSDRKMLSVEFGLVSKNQIGSGIVADLLTS